MLATDIAPDGIAVLRLDNERRRNCLSIALRDAISDTLDLWATDERVRVVVLTGTGTAFCAGFDLTEFAQPDLARTIRDSSRRYHLAVWGFAKPMIAATRRYLVSSAGVTFDDAFAVEHDRVFDEFLLGAFGPGPP